MELVYSHGKEYHIEVKKGQIGRYVILPGDPGRCEKIAGYLNHPVLIASHREYVTYTGTLEGEKVSITSTGIGGPSAAIALEELIHCGADTFIRVGTSGGIDPDVCGGDIVIATGAIRAEGTTREYAPIEYPAVADFELVQSLREAAGKLKLRSHLGVVHCKDNFYGQLMPETMPVEPELRERWRAWRECGALCSEMESAALFIVGGIRRVRVGTVLLTIANQTRREMGLEDVQEYDTDRAIQVAIEAIRILIHRDAGSVSD